MSVQNPVKFSMLYDMGEFMPDMSKTPEQILQGQRKRSFLVYQWGVWTTAHARADLQLGIDICGDYLVYVDTDSCKYIAKPEIERKFSKLNEHTVKLSEACGAYADDKNGVRHYTGVFEDDGSMKSFRTMGAKKYVYVDQQDRLHLTVSGVSKKAGAQELMEAGGIDVFGDGFIFHDSGKVAVKYNNISQEAEYKGRILTITNNAYLYPVEYTLGLTEEYDELLKVSSKTLKKVQEICISRHIYK